MVNDSQPTKRAPTIEEIHSEWIHAFHLARDRGHTDFNPGLDMKEPLLPHKSKCTRCGDTFTLSINDDGKLVFDGVALRDRCIPPKPRRRW